MLSAHGARRGMNGNIQMRFIKHILVPKSKLHETRKRDAQTDLSIIGMLSNQTYGTLSACISIADWNRVPIDELERHYMQNGRENYNSMDML